MAKHLPLFDITPEILSRAIIISEKTVKMDNYKKHIYENKQD